MNGCLPVDRSGSPATYRNESYGLAAIPYASARNSPTGCAVATCAIQQNTCHSGRTLNLIVFSSVLWLTSEPNQLAMQVLLYSGTVGDLIPWSNTLDNLKRLAGFWHSPR